jgi:hypothetical protein
MQIANTHTPLGCSTFRKRLAELNADVQPTLLHLFFYFILSRAFTVVLCTSTHELGMRTQVETKMRSLDKKMSASLLFLRSAGTIKSYKP